MNDARVEQVSELYVFARAVKEFYEGFWAVASSIHAAAMADESQARHWLSQIKARMDAAAAEMDALGRELDFYQDRELTEDEYYRYRNLLNDYKEARECYEAACARYEQAESRFGQLRQTLAAIQNDANGAATRIACVGREAEQSITRAATLISEDYNQ